MKAMMVHKKFHDNAEMFFKLGNNPIQNVEEMKYLVLSLIISSTGKDISLIFQAKPKSSISVFTVSVKTATELTLILRNLFIIRK